MKVRKAMHTDARCCAPATTLTELARMMKAEDIGAIPVSDSGGQLVGIVTDRDIIIRSLAQGMDPARTTARDVMSQPLITCQVDDSLGEAVSLMEERRIRRLPVVDRKGRLVGMLSLGDVCHAAGQRRCGELIRTVSAHHPSTAEAVHH